MKIKIDNADNKRGEMDDVKIFIDGELTAERRMVHIWEHEGQQTIPARESHEALDRRVAILFHLTMPE